MTYAGAILPVSFFGPWYHARRQPVPPIMDNERLIFLGQRDELLGIARHGVEAAGLPVRLRLLDPFGPR